MSLYTSIEETKDLNNKKFNDVKEQVFLKLNSLDNCYTKNFR